ncbi:MAG: nucleotidyltransferase domain-containing protein [Clostridiales bacterium]|jgi:predicted nucleotidyltransferase|nr:nucleotidyltransferase domain-containing protein [Clostridiales bacterium]
MPGLDNAALDTIQSVCKNCERIKKVMLFGSRATGNNKKTADIDIAIIGELTPSEIWTISGLLNDESPTPYYYDVVHFDSLIDTNFIESIMASGKVIYEKE